MDTETLELTSLVTLKVFMNPLKLHANFTNHMNFSISGIYVYITFNRFLKTSIDQTKISNQ